jgi:hypothetical protein
VPLYFHPHSHKRSSSRAASSGEKTYPFFPFPPKEKESRVRSSSQPHMWREEPMLWDDRHSIVGMISRFLHPPDVTLFAPAAKTLNPCPCFSSRASYQNGQVDCFSHGKVRVARFLLSLLHPQYYYSI